MEDILALDQKLFLEMNSYHNAWLDQIMMFLSSTTGWIPLYLILFYLLLKNYRKQIWLVLLAITLTVFFADQITSSLMKPFFARLRPSHEPTLQGLVYIVSNYKGGNYGFASSHAANTFGIATLMWLLLKNYRPWIALLFFWAGFVGYTRIYLGVHYPGDIVAGQCVGLMSALATYSGFTRAKNYLDNQTVLRSGQ